MLPPSAQAIEQFIHAAFPSSSAEPQLRIESIGAEGAHLRWHVNDSALRPGATVSGPTMMALADTTAWALIMHHLGLAAAPSVTSSMNIHFLARPASVDLLAEGRVLKLGKRLGVIEVNMRSEGSADVVCHATVTYAVRIEQAD